MTQKPTMFGLQYRLSQEAVPSFYPFLGKSRVVAVGLDDLQILLTEGDPYLTKLSSDFQDRIRSLEPGPCIFVYKDASVPSGLGELVLSGNRNQSSVRVQMKDNEKKLLYQLFVGESVTDAMDVVEEEKVTGEIDEKKDVEGKKDVEEKKED